MTTSSSTYFDKLRATLDQVDDKAFDEGVELIRQAWQRGSQIITLGNGGSALTALHFINDWNKSIFMSSGKPFLGRSLVDNTGLLLAYANDVSFQDLFVEQLKNILNPQDLVIAISGSGNSENVLRAVSYANGVGAQTLGLCGYSGGKLKSLASKSIWIPKDDMQICEDLHFIFGHIVMQRLCKKS